MSRASRWPLAVTCLALGSLGALVAENHLLGQTDPPPTVPAPPKPSNLLPAPQPAPAAQPQPAVQPQPAPGPVPGIVREPVSYREIVKRVLPAVVNIDVKGGVRTEFELGFGSGVLVDPSGVVLTNYHVVEGAGSVTIELKDGRKFTSKEIRRDAKTDLAIVRIKADQPFPFLELGDSDAMEVGDPVLAVGAPFGLIGSVTHGIVSAKSRRGLRLNQYEDFIQTDAAINPGNSGGPLVSLDGKVIGINAAIKTKSGGFQGVGLAVSSNLARDVVKQLEKDGTVRRGYLGVSIRQLDAALAAKLGVANATGVVVTQVFADSPASKAGLQTGDIVTAIGGTPVQDVGTVSRLVSKMMPGDKVPVTYVRDGKTATLELTIEEQPEEYGVRTAQASPGGAKQEALGVPLAGLYVSDLTPEAVAQLGYPKGTKGALIAAVARTGPAATAGLIRGLAIVKVDKTPITSAHDFSDAIEASDAERGALLQVMRPGGEVDFVLLKVK